MAHDLDNFTAIFNGFGAPQQLLADCVGGSLPLLVNDQNELISRTWKCYLDEKDRLLRGEKFALFPTRDRIAERLSGRNYDYAIPELHCVLEGIHWKNNRCGFVFPFVYNGCLRWDVLIVLKLTTLCGIWSIAPGIFCHENWSFLLQDNFFVSDTEKVIEDILIGNLSKESENSTLPLPLSVSLLLPYLKEEPLSRQKLEEYLGAKRTTLRTRYLVPAIALGLVEPTCARRFAKDQCYRLTARGREALTQNV